jgi:hypothetical protein
MCAKKSAKFVISAAVMIIACMVSTQAKAQSQQDSDARQKAIEAERAKLKAAGPQRDHDVDQVYYAKALTEARAKAAAALKAAVSKPTPHTPDGHADLNGLWASPGGATLPSVVSDDGKTRKVLFAPLDEGGTKAREPVPPMAPNQPSYKPEYQAKVQGFWFDVNHNDPTAFTCKNPGVPRIGPPDQILETPGLVTLLYKQGTAGGNPNSTFRVIPTDGRAHRTDVDPSAMGDSIGRWEGDTLVVDVTRLDDETWLSEYGTLHSDATRVIERFTRKGDTLEYTATVEDPTVLLKLWTTTTVTRVLGARDESLPPDVPCVDNDSQHLTGLIHH